MNLSKSLLLGTVIATVTLAINPSYAQPAKHKPAAPAPAASANTDMSILATVATVDKGEILISSVAAAKKVNSDVTDFAEMMIKQHSENLNQILEMVNNPHGNFTSAEAEKLYAQGKKSMLELGALKGDEFAKAYANAMVKGHEAALNLIDQQLLKSAKTEQVKTFLTDTRAVVAEHLEHAKKLQDEVK